MNLFSWGVIALLTALNAVYVAAEFAAVAVQRSELVPLVRLGNRRARLLLDTLQDGVAIDRYIAACQIGITLSTLLAGAYSQATIARGLAPLLEARFGLEDVSAASAAAGIVLLAVTALQVLLGELVPKSIALQFPVRTALATFIPMRASILLFRAFIWFLNGSGLLLLRPFGVKPGRQAHVHSPEELERLFMESRQGGALSPELHRRLQQGVRLSRRTVHQLMVPRKHLAAIEASTSDADIVRRILMSPYSRLPVYRDRIDNLLGTVSTKDLVASYVATGSVPPLAELLRPIPFVPENLSAGRLVRLLRAERTSKAIVVDEFGGVQGMISIDDLLSELFGELGEELKPSGEHAIEQLPDGRLKLRGSLRPGEAGPWLGRDWESTAATLGGWIVSRLGRLPSPGEHIELGGVELTVLEVSATTVLSVALRSSSPGTQAKRDST